PADGGGGVRRDAGGEQLVHRRVVHLAAMRAQLAREPLGEDAAHSGAGEERLHAHLVQAGERAGGVVRVQRREHEVAGERRFDRDLGGLVGANLAGPLDVGVGAEGGQTRRWPLSSASNESFAVSRSRISPTITTSGSERRIYRNAAAKVMPARLLICTWLTPPIRYSTGSSTVMMLISGRLIWFRQAKRV